MKQHMKNKTIFFKKWPSTGRLYAHPGKEYRNSQNDMETQVKQRPVQYYVTTRQPYKVFFHYKVFNQIYSNFNFQLLLFWTISH